MRSALACLVIVAAGLAAYANSLQGDFVFDDVPSILENPSIRKVWPPGGALFPAQSDLAVSGRPAANFSLAVNYAWGAGRPRGYHALNLAIHLGAGLALFGLVRRTLLRPALSARFGRGALPLAAAVALLWTVHPLQTEAVSYITQRVESMMGLFYLLTLYCFVRYAEGESSHARKRVVWLSLSVAACLLGMGSKEVMVSAPIMALLYDRCFFAGSFAEAWRRRRAYYIALAATWLPLVYFMKWSGWSRGGAAGLGSAAGPWPYLLAQCRALPHYLRLSIWPDPLVFDYGAINVRHPGPAMSVGVILLTVLGAALYALWRNRPVGLLGAWFYFILAPSSSFIPVATQTMAEHRMYLPLAAVIVLAVLTAYAAAGRASFLLWLAAAPALAVATAHRNEAYRTAIALWSDTVRQVPGNERARNDLGSALLDAGRTTEAIGQLEAAVRLKPDSPKAQYNLGVAWSGAGRYDKAVAPFAAVVRLDPGSAPARTNLGTALGRTGHYSEAASEFEAALRLNPQDGAARRNLERLRNLAPAPAPAPRPGQSGP